MIIIIIIIIIVVVIDDDDDDGDGDGDDIDMWIINFSWQFHFNEFRMLNVSEEQCVQNEKKKIPICTTK